MLQALKICYILVNKERAYQKGYFEFPDGGGTMRGVSDLDPKDEILPRIGSSQRIKGYREEHMIKVCNGFNH